jgi:hypothetical protein
MAVSISRITPKNPPSAPFWESRFSLAGNRSRIEIIVHCKANPGIRIVDAIAVVFKDQKAKRGIKMKP